MTHVDGGGVPAGTQLNGIYEVEKRVAVGGMGEVYIGRVIQTGDRVAIKMILPEHANNEIILDLFRKEASTLHNLYHEAIVRYYVFSVDPVLNRPYLSMEFAAGPSLGDRLREGPIGEHEMTVLRRRIAGGLHAAHKLGIIHRDISPDNIILVDGDVEKAKIIDFGIAKSTTSEGTLIGSGFAGKLKYVSPEQLGLEGGDVTGKSDIYSLGLVFAEAVIGQPLSMGGSQLEVIEKRRVVPDLSQVPGFIRPLIEAMVQPNPADRPADMQAVAAWSADGAPGRAGAPAAGAGAASGRPTHPRDRLRQKAAADRRRGAPWLWIGLGGAGIAPAETAAFFVVGVERPGDDAPGSLAAGGTGTLAPAPAPVLAAPAASAVAPAARAGDSYAWTSDPFEYDGAGADLAFDAEGAMPKGLTLAGGPAGAARIAGTPAVAGEYDFTIVAAAPSGATARMAVRMRIEQGEPLLALPATPAATAPLLATPAAGDSGVSSGGGDDGTPALASTGGSGLAPVPGASALPSLPAGDRDPTADAAEPTVATALPDAPGAPSLGNGPAAPGASAADERPALLEPSGPGLGAQGPAGALPTLPAADADPTASTVEPSVATAAPGGLLAPSAGVGAGIAAGGGDGLAIPRTGGTQPQRPEPGAPAGGAALASVPSPDNQPPTVADALSAPVSVAQGQSVNARLGSFFDEADPAGMTLTVDGALPNGLAIRLAEGGVAQLYGTPAEFGEYQLRIAAVDPQGLVSQPIPVALSIAPPAENRDVRDYILAYDGGDCFLSRPMELGPQLASIEVFAAEAAVPRVIQFDADFKRDMGFEAQIGMRPITQAQCALVHALDQVGPQALDNSLVIDLDRDELTAGDTIQGKIHGGSDARLFLFDDEGGLSDLSGYVETRNGETGFSVPVTASGSQILIAARPREGAGVAASAGIEELLGAAQRGQASLALGFFIMQ